MPDSVGVHLSAAILRLFPDAERRVSVDAATVAEAVAALDARWPGIRDRLCDSTPAIRKHINVFVAGERAGLSTPLAPGSDMFVITAVSGG